MFRLAHVTDPHFQSLTGLRVGSLFGKRALGLANLLVRRRHKHKMELVDRLGEDLKAQAADHLALTGDLGNVGLESEWQAACAWLRAYAPEPRNVTVIPGNHDIYTPDVEESGAFERVFGAYQKADYRLGGEAYPFVRFRGQALAFIAVNTCVPTRDLGAWGRIGPAQMRRLETLLTDPVLEKRVRVILIHHPPVVHRRGEEHNLRDRVALCELLARTGAELILHGHDHRDEEVWLLGPEGRKIPAIGAGSASYAGGPESRARYNLYELVSRTITRITRAYDASSGTFVEVARKVLQPA